MNLRVSANQALNQAEQNFVVQIVLAALLRWIYSDCRALRGFVYRLLPNLVP